MERQAGVRRRAASRALLEGSQEAGKQHGQGGSRREEPCRGAEAADAEEAVGGVVAS